MGTRTSKKKTPKQMRISFRTTAPDDDKTRERALAAITEALTAAGLQPADVTMAVDEPDLEREVWIERARSQWQTDECEIDDDAGISLGANQDTDPGAFVQAWVWVKGEN